MRRDAVKWLTSEFNKNYKNTFETEAIDGDGEATGPTSSSAPKRQKVSVSAFFGDSEDEEAPRAKDELTEYLDLPQTSNKVDPLVWWKDMAPQFPNLAIMARQYLGCPASSASVERLFSSVGIAFSEKRQSAHAATLENIMFASENL